MAAATVSAFADSMSVGPYLLVYPTDPRISLESLSWLERHRSVQAMELTGLDQLRNELDVESYSAVILVEPWAIQDCPLVAGTIREVCGDISIWQYREDAEQHLTAYSDPDQRITESDNSTATSSTDGSFEFQLVGTIETIVDDTERHSSTRTATRSVDEDDDVLAVICEGRAYPPIRTSPSKGNSTMSSTTSMNRSSTPSTPSTPSRSGSRRVAPLFPSTRNRMRHLSRNIRELMDSNADAINASDLVDLAKPPAVSADDLAVLLDDSELSVCAG